jgi:hypothetical protein
MAGTVELRLVPEAKVESADKLVGAPCVDMLLEERAELRVVFGELFGEVSVVQITVKLCRAVEEHARVVALAKHFVHRLECGRRIVVEHALKE